MLRRNSHPAPSLAEQAFVLAALILLTLGSCGGSSEKAEPTTTTIRNGGMDVFVAPSGTDGNDGSQRRPFRTIQRAASTAMPGMTIHVAPGTYSESPQTNASGVESARIVFVSDTKWGAKVIGSGDSVWTNNGSFVDIKGFEVTSTGGSTRIGILNLGSNSRMIANHVHHIPAPGCSDSGGAGIQNGNFSGHDNDVIANVVHNIADLNISCNKVHGIYHNNLRGHIRNNLVFSAQGWGISLWHAANNVIIANNTVVNNGYGGITVGAGDDPGGVTDDSTTVANNIVFKNGRGIMEFGATGSNNEYVNNLVIGNGDFDVKFQNGIAAAGTVVTDPRFVNPGGGDYHLSRGSPAIDAGTDLDAPPNDTDGGSRPVGKGWDIGAYEFGSKPAQWPFM